MRLLQNPDGLQGKATQYGEKKTGQTAFNGCEYRFLDKAVKVADTSNQG